MFCNSGLHPSIEKYIYRYLSTTLDKPFQGQDESGQTSTYSNVKSPLIRPNLLLMYQHVLILLRICVSEQT